MNPRVPARWSRFQSDGWKDESGSLASEVFVKIQLNGIEVAGLPASPHRLDALAIGHLLLDGYVFEPRSARTAVALLPDHALVGIEAPGARREEWKTLPRVPQAPPPQPKEVFDRVAALRERAELYAGGGGVHTSALFDAAELRFLAEDVGKVNTLDRLAGESALAGGKTDGMTLAVTGRVTAAMARRAVLLGCPIVLSASGPTSQGLEIASRAGIRIVGYARGRGFNLYGAATMEPRPPEPPGRTAKTDARQ